MMDKKKVLQLKKFLLIAMGLMFILYIGNKLSLNDKFDRTYPEISFDKDLVKVSVDATEEDLLKGVTATDRKDGDVTDSIIIESMSNMLDDDQRIVTYVAFDGDNHVGKAERRIQYTDYTPIRFSMDEPINRNNASEEEMKNGVVSILKATDCIDGDISSQIVIGGQSYGGEKEEYLLYNYVFQVTSSSGEIASIKIPVKTEFKGEILQSGEIELSKGLVYTKIGEKLNLKSFIKSVQNGAAVHSADDVKITTDLDTSKAGSYVVTYSLQVDGQKAMCDMIVVVEE